MTVTKCPEWEYKDIPGAEQKLKSISPQILLWILSKSKDEVVCYVRDTRRVHEYLFKEVTPPSFPYYAGNYRGDDFLCLRHLEVGIRSNPLVGAHPTRVSAEMSICSDDIRQAIDYLDILWPVNEQYVPRSAKIRRTAEIAAAIFSSFLIIHPYANGNGHIARFIAIVIFARFGIRLRRWPMDPRPAPPYSEVIFRYQHNEKEPLIKFIIGCI